YSGADEKSGLHLVPEKGTHVFVVWTGQIHCPAIVLGNVRHDPVRVASPALLLDKKTRLSLAEVEVEKVQKIAVQSHLSVEVAKKTVLKSSAAMHLLGDGAEATFSGGTFNVGQGG